MNQTFVPDYSVRATTDVFYVAIKRTLYLAAKRATLMEKSKRFGSELGSNEPIDYEVEKVNNQHGLLLTIHFEWTLKKTLELIRHLD